MYAYMWRKYGHSSYNRSFFVGPLAVNGEELSKVKEYSKQLNSNKAQNVHAYYKSIA